MAAEMRDDIAPLAEVRAHLSTYVDSAMRTHQRVTITKNGKPAAILMSVDDYESLMETLEILAEPGALAEIRQAEADIASGAHYTLDDVKADLDKRE